MNVILLVQTLADATNLKPSLVGLAKLAPDAIWLIHSPAVLVDLDASNAQIDQQIAAVNAQIALCIGREDYTGAESYKQQRHALTLQKSAAATDAYKTMTPEQQESATTRVFGDFWAAKPAPKMRLSMHPQHHEPREWIEMLNSLKGAWPAEMQHGHFVVAWPGQFVGQKMVAGVDIGFQNPPVVTTAVGEISRTQVVHTYQTKEKKPKTGYTSHPRFAQLCSTGLDALGQIALQYKLMPSGGRLKIAHLIAKHEEANGLLDKPRA